MGRFSLLSKAQQPPHEDRPASDLTVSLLRDYAATLPSDGRQATTRHRKLAEAERMWAWGEEQPERFGAAR